MAETTGQESLSTQKKVISLFKYISELNRIRTKTSLRYTDNLWAKTLSDIPDDPENIAIYYRDRTKDDNLDSNDMILLSVHKPELEKCPAPDAVFRDWLKPGWDSFKEGAHYIEKKNVAITKLLSDTKESYKVEYFYDNQKRVKAFRAWREERSIWVERQKILDKTKRLFSDLYRIYFDLQRDSETHELIVANGVLCDRNNRSIEHPILTKRVKINYDPLRDIVTITEIDSQPELYTILFQAMDGINLSTINQLQNDLRENDYHPLDRNDTPEFLKVLVHQLSSDSKFSASGKIADWQKDCRFFLYLEPMYIMRKRLDGTLKAIEQIIENVEKTEYIPEPIKEIVSGGKVDTPEDVKEESIEERLAAVGGESIDVLLSKEANKEQLEIAKRIERYNAVLVQGPPGTGKTHTIANLMGHFLAQGKSVLVTSHTSKALSVLKEKLVPGLQNLCVSVLEDSNVDMERSIDGITDFMSRHTAFELKKEMDELGQIRRKIVSDLADVRRKIFHIINQENNSLVYLGEEISPSKAAAFVADHADDLSYIPGKVKIPSPIPLSFSELVELYQSNDAVSVNDEKELSRDIPEPEELLSPVQFLQTLGQLQLAEDRLNEIASESSWSYENHPKERKISFSKEDKTFSLIYPERDSVMDLKKYASSFTDFEPWMEAAAVAGKNGEAYKKPWQMLIQEIEETCDFSESLIEEQFGKEIIFLKTEDAASFIEPLTKLKSMFEQKGKVSRFSLLFNKDCSEVLDTIQINGQALQSASDCEVVLHHIERLQKREKCARYWNDLLGEYGVPSFKDLNAKAPENIAKNWIPNIEKYLSWYETAYTPLLEKMNAVGIPEVVLFAKDPLDSDTDSTRKILDAVANALPNICDICRYVVEAESLKDPLNQTAVLLQKGTRVESVLCQNLVDAIRSRDADSYTDAFAALSQMYRKYELQIKRRQSLEKLKPFAPQWAAAIENREGIHGDHIVPDSIEDAWKWKQLSGIINDLIKEPFSDLQEKSLQLSKDYREITAKYAEKCAWYHLLCRTEGDLDIRQALQGWKQTVKKIGKGTGKNAPKWKALAKEKMRICQDAVPSWIMPINRALETLDPRTNRFDVVIIDEASQSDVSSLAILYMGRKLIIVGDDKQVSPMGVGVDVEKINALQEIYISKIIPNAHLYDAKTSIYDIAKTTFQPLMLREHFRCVPDIIGFSNMLSYDYKIKPLRESSSSQLLPAVVNYRVVDGERQNNKTNSKEAQAIVALMQACMEQPEYEGKTFGIISLLGTEQVKIMQRMIEEQIDHKELVGRNILCGDSSNFQGDERDVIFLSMVDSNPESGKGPLALKGFGVDDAYRKRYNVAASRAKDQLWVVDSLDAANDLKPNDIRKTLIDYSKNPSAYEFRHTEIEKKAESPFESSIAKALSDRGYKLVQQWKVGAYRLDMVAVYKTLTVAIECDGERYHSGESQIRADMERQTILERLGWRFVRIRGSEYYRHPKETIDRVVEELTGFGIMPDLNNMQTEQTIQQFDLLSRVKNRAAVILHELEADGAAAIDQETIAAALDPKNNY